MVHDRLQRFDAVMGEHECHLALADLLAEFLQHQRLKIVLVVNYEDVSAQLAPPVLASAAAARGNVTINSVNEPGSVTTSILPPCSFTTISWLIDSPRPVPSPAGLVVKNGSNIFSFTSSG